MIIKICRLLFSNKHFKNFYCGQWRMFEWQKNSILCVIYWPDLHPNCSQCQTVPLSLPFYKLHVKSWKSIFSTFRRLVRSLVIISNSDFVPFNEIYFWIGVWHCPTLDNYFSNNLEPFLDRFLLAKRAKSSRTKTSGFHNSRDSWCLVNSQELFLALRESFIFKTSRQIKQKVERIFPA